MLNEAVAVAAALFYYVIKLPRQAYISNIFFESNPLAKCSPCEM